MGIATRTFPIRPRLRTVLWVACAVGALGASPPSLGAGEASSDPGLSIRLRPRVVYTNALVTATLHSDAPLPEPTEFHWAASAGLLHYDDLAEVRWRAPATAGEAVIEVTLHDERRSRSARLTVDVRQPSTEDMIWIPAGTFLCGDFQGTRDPGELKTVQVDNDDPIHAVYLDGYWIDKYPVTNERFARFLEAAMEEGLVRIEDIAVVGEFDGEWVPFYYFKSYELLLFDFADRGGGRKPFFLHLISWDGEKLRVRAGYETHPIADVTWFGAMAYANYYGKQPPTEAQWEKAARGSEDARPYPWGWRRPSPYDAPSGDILPLAPVGSFSPYGDSPYGVCDMLSGCFEWTSDWFNPDYYEDFGGPGPHRNPTGTFWGRSHAIRGFPSALSFKVDPGFYAPPVSLRYEWIFDHMLGDCFANRQSTFRCAVSPGHPLGSTSQGRSALPMTTEEAARRSPAAKRPATRPATTP